MAVFADCAAIAVFAGKHAEVVVHASRLVLAVPALKTDVVVLVGPPASAVKSIDPLALMRHIRSRCSCVRLRFCLPRSPRRSRGRIHLDHICPPRGPRRSRGNRAMNSEGCKDDDKERGSRRTLGKKKGWNLDLCQ